MLVSNRLTFSTLAAAIALACAIGGARASTDDEVRATFDRFVQVQNAHDTKALETLLAASPPFL